MSILSSLFKSVFTSKRTPTTNTGSSIPKTIHIIWIGDERLRPDENIASWTQLNPDFTIKLWGNHELMNRPWRNARHMMQMWDKELCAVADLMRYEILFEEGGIYVDADSVCLKPLDELLLENEFFACWESELVRPGLISNSYLGTSAGNRLLQELIEEIASEETVTDRPAWQGTGPVRLTNAFLRLAYSNLTIFPSHFFHPQHFSGMKYTGPGRIYATHHWDSTRHHQRNSGEQRPARPQLLTKLKQD